MPEKTKRKVLQVGESTHQHVLVAEEEFEVESAGNDSFEFMLNSMGIITHEEHNRIVLDKGKYVKYPQVEFDPLAGNIRQVYD